MVWWNAFPAGFIFFAFLAKRSGFDYFRDRSTLGIREAGGQSALEMLKQNLQDSLRAAMLFVLDNFEPLIQAARLCRASGDGAPAENYGYESRRAAPVWCA